MKTFYSKYNSKVAKSLYLFLTILLLLAFWGFFKAPSLFKVMPGIIILLILLGLLLAMSLSQITYKILITDDGNLIETALFKKTRTLNISEIDSISLRAFSDTTPLVATGAYLGGNKSKVESPKIINKKFNNFPRYIMSPNFFSSLKAAYPQIKIDSNINLKS